MNAFAVGSTPGIEVQAQTSAPDEVDDIEVVPTSSLISGKLTCCNRVGHGWCVLEDHHAGACVAINPDQAPTTGEYKPPDGALPGSWSSSNRRRF
jgi:hypothetical protein